MMTGSNDSPSLAYMMQMDNGSEYCYDYVWWDGRIK
jgi:hypothetical protein